MHIIQRYNECISDIHDYHKVEGDIEVHKSKIIVNKFCIRNINLGEHCIHNDRKIHKVIDYPELDVNSLWW